VGLGKTVWVYRVHYLCCWHHGSWRNL